jgi:BlaI family transcriptional regulator, penicillinase repressor
MADTRHKPHGLPQLAPAELDVMKVLWRDGRLSARELHERLEGQTGWAYSTTRTVTERMVAKGLLTRQGVHGLNVYAAAVSRPAGLAGLVREFAEQVLELRHVPVAALFAESEALSPAELAELRALLDERPTAKRPRGRR